jgi:hypothetical protein
MVVERWNAILARARGSSHCCQLQREDLIMWRISSAFCLGAAICLGGSAAATADDKGERHQIKGGIEGKVKMVDVENKTLTIVTDDGRSRTFTVTDETMMAGPRGGKVRRHLKDPRFHEGFPVTIVAEGNMATEVHLGFARQADQERTEPGARPTRAEPRPAGQPQDTPRSRISRKVTPAPSEGRPPSRTSIQPHEAKKLEEEDETEIPGKIESFDATKRILVLSLLNGQTRSFMLPRDVPVEVGSKASRQGLHDPALKAGATVTVFTDEGGRRVKELKIAQHRWFRRAG